MLESYIDEFENIRSLMLQNNHILPDAYMLDSFVWGFKPVVKLFFKAFKPITIAWAVGYARLEEESLLLNNPKYSTTTYSNPQVFAICTYVG